MELLDVGRIVLGVILLVGGGELLVRGASSLAVRAGMSSLVVGLTVVAAATSAPELAVTTGAVLDGETALAIGNVVGSNIANVLLILGISALAAPLVVRRVLVRMDVPVLVGLSLLTLVLALDGEIGRGDGVVLLVLLVAHAAVAIVVSRRDPIVAGEQPAAEDSSGPGVLVSVALVVIGVGLLVLGARVLVAGAVSIATGLGVSGLVVGLTVVAVGTSLPELATSVIATIRGERDLAVGNIVGSCIFNLGMVLGLPALLAPGGLAVPAAAVALDLPLMIATAVALAPVVFTGYRVGRREGGLFLLLYAAYVGYVVLDATSHDALEGFTTIMVIFVLPLVVLALVGAVAYDLGRRKERRLAARAQPSD
ncbi:calcium/sodium antiporter [Ornithinimicrobium flavum]|uniref:calcium/sodium antiporter n=1 Tax=Ornithinimicrobium flavum TaxID=1288636 RepID=UPI0010706300|nr:calcium/sodium antiporter [Ornithinimicrobium flavum]